MSGILVVDDEVIIAHDIDRRLREMGYEVSGVALTPKEAIEAAIASQPAIVLMDVNLSAAIDGVKTAALIRETRDVPVVFVTSYSDQATIDAATAGGAYSYLVKPVTNASLRTAVEVALARHASDAEVRNQEQWLRTTFCCVGDGLIATDAGGRIVMMNATSATLTGWGMEEALGQRVEAVLKLVMSEGGETAASLVGNALRDGKTVFMAEGAVLVRRDGARISVEDSVAPIIGQGNETLGAVIVFRDVTERRRMEERLRRLNIDLADQAADLEAANHELQTFSHTVAHDLRSPLRSIASYGDVVLEDFGAELPPAVREFATQTVETVARLDRMIEDLLAYAQVSRAEVELSAVSLKTVVAQVLREHAPAVQTLAAHIEVHPGLPSVIANETVLRQVLSNLVSNALKFVAQGAAPHVVITAEAKGKIARLWVEDNGIGIAPGLQDRAFEVFQRLAPGDDYPGTGIGLAIVARGVERMAGACGVVSSPGAGSRFWIDLLSVEANVDEG